MAAAASAEPPEKSRPIGVFDSGTGGLAVLEQIVKLDLFDNQTQELVEKRDGRPDFQQERFVFLADQANMPYGNYPVIGKERFLVELVENDARFLLGNQYFASPTAAGPSTDKRPAKAIVIACNTATAFGKTAVESLVAKTAPEVEVIGVIDAAARGALEAFRQGPSGTIGVLATEGTVASGAYPKAIRELARQMALREEVPVVQQGAYGLAGAVDGAPEFIARGDAGNRPRPDYRGPSLANPLATIDERLLPRYHFDFSAYGMLWDGDGDHPSTLQINSVENYIAYHLVSLLERLRAAPQAKPMNVLVLGCTHYPFYAETIRAQLARLYDYRENDRCIYRPCLAANVQLIDPAVYVGKELYQRLARKKLLAESAALAAGETRGEFYITVPCRRHPGVQLEAGGWFTYGYKYGRSPGQSLSDVRAVPWDESYLNADVANRLARQVPTVWGDIRQFKADSAKGRVRDSRSQ
jgi:glutamate racemase